MQIPRIYSNQSLSEGQEIVLEKQASQHLLKVLRVRAGAHLVIFNGQSGEYLAELISADRSQRAVIKLLKFNLIDRESPLNIHLLQGISRGERMDFVMQKATELGVTSITPLFSERCNVKLKGDRLKKRLDHWRAVVISATEQSGRCQLPEVREPCSFNEFLSTEKRRDPIYICDVSHQKAIHDEPSFKNEVSVLVGPEGGFSDDELNLAEQKNLSRLSLGPRVLRTETAAIVAITLLQSRGGDL